MISFQSMYELMVVGSVDGAASLFEKVEKFLKEAEASNLKSEKMGKKNLAYPIKKQTEAEYFLFNFDAPPSQILQLDRKIRLEQEAVLRHLLIKTKPVRESKKKVKVESQSEKKEEPKIEAKPKVTVTTRPPATKAPPDFELKKSSRAGAGEVGQAKITTSKKEAKPVKSTSNETKAKKRSNR